MLFEGLKLLVVGMGVVYLFLILLMYAIVLLGRLLASVTAAEKVAKQAKQDRQRSDNQSEQGPVLAAIATAVSAYRRRHSR